MSSQMQTVSRVSGEDEFTTEQETDCGQALWRVLLSNGETIVQDDGRPGGEPPSAWLRLGDYVRENGLSIRKLWLQFRSNKQEQILPEDAEGYFFSKGILGSFNGGSSRHYYVLGYLSENRLYLTQIAVPELLVMEKEERDPATADKTLIRNPCVPAKQ